MTSPTYRQPVQSRLVIESQKRANNYAKSLGGEDAVTVERSVDTEAPSNYVISLYRGLWYAAHLMASRADTREGKAAFEALMASYAASFPCSKCRLDIADYLSKNPLSKCTPRQHNGKDISYAYWLWIFHNVVNTKLSKPYFDWDAFVQVWLTDNAACSADCARE